MNPAVLIASVYVFVLAAFLGYQVISRVPPLLHHAVEHASLVAQRRARRRIETELEGNRRLALEVRMACLPHLAEAADPGQFFQFPIDAGQRAIAGLEAR